MRNWGWLVRVIILLGALGGVIYAMKQLNTKGVNKDVLFLDETAPQETKPQSVSNILPEEQRRPHAGVPEIELCDTRVKDIQFRWDGQNYNIQNSGKRWQANGKDLPAVDMEKWLVLLCRVKAERLLDLATSTQKFTFADQIVFNYVNGQSLKFGVETPAFKFGDKAFYSRPFLDLTSALKTMIGTKTK